MEKKMIFKLLKKIIIIAALSCTCFTMLAACGEEEEPELAE